VTWPVVTLSEVAEIQGGIQKQPKRTPRSNSFPFLRVANVTAKGLDLAEVHTIELFDGELERYRLVHGDLLVVEGNGSPSQIGRASLWDGSIRDAVHQNHLIRVRPRQLLDPRFLGHLWSSPSIRGELTAVASSTSGLHTLSVTKLKRILVPLPPLTEQRRIVEILEDHLSRLDAAGRNLGTASRRLKALENSLLEGYFAGDGLVPLDTLVTDISAGKSFGTANAPAAEGDWGIIKVSAMTWGEFKAEENKAVSAGKVDPRFEIHEGDLLVSRANTADYVGASVLVGAVRPRLLLSDKSLRLTPANDVDSEWLWRAMQAPSARRQMTELATGTKDSMRNISQVALRRVMLPRRDKSMQLEALAAYGEGSSAAATLHSQLVRNERMLQQLRRSLLTAAFSGRLTSDRQHLDTEELVSS
jgi:type I restriction enzyme, S subunit